MNHASDNVQRAGFPASLAGADPFAAPPVSPQPVSGSASATGARARSATSAALAVNIPCPCACGCGNDTGKTYNDIESFSATRFLRCEPCGKARHFGPQFNASSGGAPSVDTPNGLEHPHRADARMGASDTSGVGSRTGTTVIVRSRHTDPADDEWDRQIRVQLETERRQAAINKWQEALPERWQMPYREGEELVPEVEERLERFRAATGADANTRPVAANTGSHGTSLLCIGPFGTGKTWVAYTYARAAVDQWLLWPQEIRIGTESEIMEPIASASPWDVAKVTKALLRPNLKMLIIDDVGTLGTYKNVEARHAVFTKVVNWMYEHKRALVITTNLDLGNGQGLDNWIGPTAYERLKHMVGKNQVFREEEKRAELTALWEAEYQVMAARGSRD